MTENQDNIVSDLVTNWIRNTADTGQAQIVPKKGKNEEISCLKSQNI
jgi:hypothetical protein